MLQSRVSHESPTTSRALGNSGWIASIPGALQSRSLFDHLENFNPGDERCHPRVPGPCFLTKKHGSGIKEVFEEFLSPIHSVLGRGQQHTIPTVHIVDSTLIPFPQTLDGCPEPFRIRPKVALHSLTGLFPHLGLFLGHCHSYTLLGLPVPVCLPQESHRSKRHDRTPSSA